VFGQRILKLKELRIKQLQSKVEDILTKKRTLFETIKHSIVALERNIRL